MTQREYEFLSAYFLNYMTILEGEVTQIRNNVRFRSIDQVDCLELALAIERLNAFKDFTKNVRAILKLSKFEEEETEL